MKKDPNTIALEISKGDIASFEFFYKAEFDNIAYFVNGYIHNTEWARDIAQESLLKLWEKREMIDPSKNLRALAYTIAKNKTINELKTHSALSNTTDINEINADIMALSDDSLYSEIDALNLKELIERTMENLPDSVRDSFKMSRELGMTNKEIAEAKKISLTGVEYHIKISLKIFREKLKEYLTIWGWILFFLYIN